MAEIVGEMETSKDKVVVLIQPSVLVAFTEYIVVTVGLTVSSEPVVFEGSQV